MTSAAPRLFFRTQASPQIGMGHFMRCFALAEAARHRDIPVTFLMTEAAEEVRRRCSDIGADCRTMTAEVASVADIDALLKLGLRHSDWVIFDTYNDLKNIRVIWDSWARVVVFDDLALPADIRCDIVVNAAMAAPNMAYNGQFGFFRKALLGPAYALIRREFTETYCPSTEGRSVTVMFGGSDPDGLTMTCAEVLHDALPGVIIKVIAGPANVHTNDLFELEKRLQDMRLYTSPPCVAEILAGSELVITAAGGSVGEVAAMGLPALVLVAYDNQKAALAACPFPTIDARRGLPDDLGHTVKALLDDDAGRTQIASRAHALVDGKGAQRILEAMDV